MPRNDPRTRARKLDSWDPGLKIVKKDNSSLHLKKKDQRNSKTCVESTRWLEIRKHPEREGGFLKIQKIGPVLDAKVCLLQNRFGRNRGRISVRDGTASWLRIVNGVDKYVTETTETTPTGNVERSSSGKLVAKARPQLKPAVTLSPISFLLCQRKWIDINPERFHQDCFSTFHEIMKEFKAKFDGVSQWSINDWMSFLNNTEIFELNETSSKQQCPDCNFSGMQALSTVLVEDA